MDLRLLSRVLWRHKWIMGLALIIGAGLTFNVLYQPVYGSGPKWDQSSSGLTGFKPRSFTNYETKVKLLLDSPDFGLGKLGSMGVDTLPRTVSLAKTYSYMVTSEQVMARLRRKFKVLPGSITALNIADVPVIEITVQGRDSQAIQKLAAAAASNFITYIRDAQQTNAIADDNRVIIETLGPPAGSTPLKSRKSEIALLTFLSAVMAGGAVSFLVENLGQRKTGDTRPGE